jgi:hypothetical protein
MLGNYQVAAQLVASPVFLSSILRPKEDAGIGMIVYFNCKAKLA